MNVSRSTSKNYHHAIMNREITSKGVDKLLFQRKLSGLRFKRPYTETVIFSADFQQSYFENIFLLWLPTKLLPKYIFLIPDQIILPGNWYQCNSPWSASQCGWWSSCYCHDYSNWGLSSYIAAAGALHSTLKGSVYK